MRVILLLLCLVLSAQAWPALPTGPVEIETELEYFEGNDTVAYVQDLNSGEIYTVNGPRCLERHPPFSSFKIPNFLIALETGKVSGLSHLFPYSPERRPRKDFWPQDWAQDQTLESAFRRSSAWVFQDIALLLGDEIYAGYLESFQYGNRVAQGDAFWLDRSLTISPKEQVDFLRRLLTNQLEIAPLHVDSLRKVALLQEKDGFRLYGKTGSGPTVPDAFDGEFEGWLVGWLEAKGRAPVVYALWVRAANFDSLKTYRQKAVVELLSRIGTLPLNW